MFLGNYPAGYTFWIVIIVEYLSTQVRPHWMQHTAKKRSVSARNETVKSFLKIWKCYDYWLNFHIYIFRFAQFWFFEYMSSNIVKIFITFVHLKWHYKTFLLVLWLVLVKSFLVSSILIRCFFGSISSCLRAALSSFLANSSFSSSKAPIF